MSKKVIFWFRQDLRVLDNPGLYEASKHGEILPIYIFDKNQDDFQMGRTSRWWLHNSLISLNKKLDNKLNLYKGKSADIVQNLIKEHNINLVVWNKCFEPWRNEIDQKVVHFLDKINIDFKSFNATLLWEPDSITKSDGTPYKVFTPFYRKGCLSAPAPRKPDMVIPKFKCLKDVHSLQIQDLRLCEDMSKNCDLSSHWKPGEDGAQKRLETFATNGLKNYKEGRNIPSKENVSRLSPHLHFGEISINLVWYTIKEQRGKAPADDIDHFLSELGWREFSYSLLHNNPDMPRKNMQKKFDNFPWVEDKCLLKSWQEGQTGYPIVDAGMRELVQTGYMHNRVRMIVGSFLVKNMLMHWHHGEDWFWNYLADADLANNSSGWQWIAGCGADAAPYFRVFNPITQGEKFDPDGLYTKKYVPELKNLPSNYLFKPWEAPASVLDKASIILGKNYPKPIVNLQNSRKRALDAFATLSKSAKK